jgi:hypothetical protein
MNATASCRFKGGVVREWVRGHVPHCLVAVVLVSCVFRVVLAIESPRPWGYVWDRYDRGISLLYENGALAESTDCWQCYHPPVFYYAGLPLYWLGVKMAGDERVQADPNSPLYAVGLLSLLCAAVVLYYCYRFLRFYQFRGDYVVLGFITAAIFPCLYISSWGIEADIVLTAVMCAYLFEITRYFSGSASASLWSIVRPAVLAGLAVGTKYNGLLSVPVAFALIVIKRRPGERVRFIVRDLAVFALLVVAIGGWKYVDNYEKYDTPLFANGTASAGFSLDKEYYWDLYDFTSFRLGELIHLMSPQGPKGKLYRVEPYESVWTTLHALAWSDMSFFSRVGRSSKSGQMYKNKNIPVWMPASVLTLALLPNALAALGLVTTLRRRSLWPMHILGSVTMIVYIQWFLSQARWALKTKYILFLLPIYLVYLCFGLKWIEKRAPTPVVKALWIALAALLSLTHIYMFRFSIGN